MNIRVKFFGFGDKAAGSETLTWKVPEKSSCQELWQLIQQDAEPGSKLAEITADEILFLHNDRPLRGLSERENTLLAESEQVTIMTFVTGG